MWNKKSLYYVLSEASHHASQASQYGYPIAKAVSEMAGVHFPELLPPGLENAVALEFEYCESYFNGKLQSLNDALSSDGDSDTLAEIASNPNAIHHRARDSLDDVSTDQGETTQHADVTAFDLNDKAEQKTRDGLEEADYQDPSSPETSTATLDNISFDQSDQASPEAKGTAAEPDHKTEYLDADNLDGSQETMADSSDTLVSDTSQDATVGADHVSSDDDRDFYDGTTSEPLAMAIEEGNSSDEVAPNEEESRSSNTEAEQSPSETFHDDHAHAVENTPVADGDAEDDEDEDVDSAW